MTVFVPTEVNVGNQALYIEVAGVGPPQAAVGPETAGVTPAELLGRMETVGVAAGEACVALYRKMSFELAKVRPDEVTVEFGLTLGGEAGVPFVAKGTAEASFKISATWKPASTNQS
jgi:hypothetical protein